MNFEGFVTNFVGKLLIYTYFLYVRVNYFLSGSNHAI